MQLKRLAEWLNFAEGPRWHDDKLWFSDIFANRIYTLTEEGELDLVTQFEDGQLPSGLGFLPDGSLLIVNMVKPEILRRTPDGQISVHADLSELACGGLNDMVVDGDGFAYVGSLGTHGALEPRPLPVPADGNVILVAPDGQARIVAQEMDAPNGPILTGDGSTYVVAEFPAKRLIGFTRDADGGLRDRRVWADLSPGSADGIAVNRENGIWTASPREHECRLIIEGGECVERVVLPDDQMPVACALGGRNGDTLFILSAIGGEDAIRRRTNTAAIDAVTVEVPAW